MPTQANADWSIIYSGDIAPADGVFGDEATAKLTLEALTITRKERDLWKETANILEETINAHSQTMINLQDELKASIETERAVCRKEIMRQKRGKAVPLIVGIAVGVAVGAIVGK